MSISVEKIHFNNNSILFQDEINITKDKEDIQDDNNTPQIISNYWAESDDNNQVNLPVYNEELGLAMEELREGLNLNLLWQIFV